MHIWSCSEYSFKGRGEAAAVCPPGAGAAFTADSSTGTLACNFEFGQVFALKNLV